MFKNLLLGSTPFMPSFVDRGYGPRPAFFPVFAPEGGAGGSGDGDGGSGAGEGEGGSGEGEGGAGEGTKKPDDKEAKRLARELASKQKALETANSKLNNLESELKKFEGIDPEAVKALLSEKAEAEAAKQKAEEDRLKAAGDFEALKKRMADQHQKELVAAQDQVKAAQTQAQALQRQIHELTIGAAFSASAFLRDETLLPPAKARRAYEDYFEVTENGQVQAYDRPAGEKDRAPLVDSRGRPLPFDEAMKQIIEADPDRDHLLKSKAKTGSGQAPGGGTGTRTSTGNEGGRELRGVAAIAAALARKGSK